jgi:hypothetical protein
LTRSSEVTHREGSGASPSPGERDPGEEETPAHAERRRSAFEDVRSRSRFDDADRDDSPGSVPASAQQDSEDEGPEAPEDELERLRKELAELREEQREVMGEPVDAPADVEPRFGGAAMSGAVAGALGEANVPGEVEATDCSEHPCIVFGRLESDEEDMEEVERAAALSAYDGDVLTLLFWATSVEEPGATPAETGLFALAFYSFEDRAGRGDELDRRIRARTMEYWNHDRPGRAAPSSP